MAIKSRAMRAAGLMMLLCLPCLPSLAQGGFVPSVPIVKGSANNQVARWDVAAGKWIPVAGASLDSTGHLVAASVTAGGNLLGPYTLPTASGSVLGAIKVGSGLSIDGGGVLSNTYSFSLTSAGIISALGYTPQAAGSYITALTGDVMASGPGSAAATLKSTGTAGTYAYPSSVTMDAHPFVSGDKGVYSFGVYAASIPGYGASILLDGQAMTSLASVGIVATQAAN